MSLRACVDLGIQYIMVCSRESASERVGVNVSDYMRQSGVCVCLGASMCLLNVRECVEC